jgi:hypothetical protein
MVEVSGQVAELLKEVRRAYKIQPSAGLRFYGASPDGSEEQEEQEEQEVMVTFCEEPLQGDEVIEQRNTKLFIAPEVADRLEGASLNAKPGPRPVLTVEYADA